MAQRNQSLRRSLADSSQALSNPEEERLLATPAHRALIAERITSAFGDYFHREQPTRVAG